MSAWTHAICERCWFQLRDGIPVRAKDAPMRTCCWCGGHTNAGIFLRSDPKRQLCLGHHPEDEPKDAPE